METPGGLSSILSGMELSNGLEPPRNNLPEVEVGVEIVEGGEELEKKEAPQEEGEGKFLLVKHP